MKVDPYTLNEDMTLQPLIENESDDVVQPLVELGLKSLLEQAFKLKVLKEPFGRPDMNEYSKPFQEEQSPEKTKEEISPENENDDDDSDEGEEMIFNPPEFKFDYGFNPCLYLGKFLHKYNPKNIEQVYQTRKDALLYLRKRASQAKRQIETFAALQEELQALRSGISSGPLCGSVTSNSAILWARATRPGQLIFEYDEEPDFSGGEIAIVGVNEDTDLAGKVYIEDLNANKKYYYRCCLSNESFGFSGIDDGYFRCATFKTLPEYPNGDSALKFILSSLSNVNEGVAHSSAPIKHFNPLEAITEDEGEAALSTQQEKDKDHNALEKSTETRKLFRKPTVPNALTKVINASDYSFMVLLGSQVPADPPSKFITSSSKFISPFSEDSVSLDNSAALLSGYYSLYKNYYYNNEIIKNLSQIGTLSAWNDSSEGALENLRAVEDIAAEATNNMKKNGSSPKKNLKTELPMTPSTRAFLNYSPLFEASELMSEDNEGFSKEAQLQAKGFTYRNLVVCDGIIEFFFTDSRGAKLGARQAQWLIDSVKDSSATWKVIVTYPSVAYKYKDSQPLTALSIKNVSSNSKTTLQRKGSGTSNSSLPVTERSNKSSTKGGHGNGKINGEDIGARKEGSIKAKGSVNGDALETKSIRSTLSRKKSQDHINPTDRTRTMQSVVLELGQKKVKNVLFLSGEMPQPFVATVGPLAAEPTTNSAGTSASSSPKRDKIKHEKDKKDKKDKKKKEPPLPPGTYFEFGACSFALEDENTDIEKVKNTIDDALSSNSIEKQSEILNVQEIIPITLSARSPLYGLVTVSKSGKIKYSLYSSKDETKRYSHEIRPQK